MVESLRILIARHSLKPLLWFLAGYVVLFFWLAYRKHTLCTSNCADTSIFVHAVWATLQGKFFPDYTLEISYFGDHASYITLVMVPVYWLLSGPGSLLFVQTLFIAAAGLPMYLIARRVLADDFAALCVAIAFLLFPTVASQHVQTIHDTQFIVVFLLFTFYFYHVEKFGWFVALALVSCLGKENVPLTILMFGVYAALQRRHWKWIVTPIAIAVVALGLIFKVIMPFFRGGKPYRSFGYFGALGDSPGAVLQTVLTRPILFLGTLFSGQNALYLVQLLQPLAWVLPLLSLPIIFVLPDLGVNLLAENSALRVIRWHYNVTVGAFLFVATIFTVQKLARWLAVRYGAARYAAGFAIMLVCLSASQWMVWFDINEYRRPPQYEALREALALVPSEASVLVPQTTLSHVANRWNFSTIQHWVYYRKPTDPQRIFEYQYVVIDYNERRAPWAVVPEEVVRAYASNPNYEMVFSKQNVLVFRRRGEDPLRGHQG